MKHRLRHPVRAIREPFGKAGLIVACLALVFAMAGGAFAAKGALTGKQKKEVAKIAKKEAKRFAGKPGAPGAAGAQGPKGDTGAAGAKGATGAAGANGTNGTNGSNGAAGEAGFCSLGNTECKLPPGATLTGEWMFGAPSGPVLGNSGEEALATISFPLKVPADASSHLTFEWIGLESWLEPGESYDTTDCPGSVSNPEAEPGFLCVYAAVVNFNSGTGQKREPDPSANDQLYGVHETSMGWAFSFSIHDPEVPAWGTGSWAATAPCPASEPQCV